MTRFGWIVVLSILIVALVIGGLATYFVHRSSPTTTSEETVVTPDIDPSALGIYTSGEYGFSFFYPSAAIISDAFSTSTTLVPWRSLAVGTGTPIVQVKDVSGDVRIGVSEDQEGISACTKKGTVEEPIENVTVGSTTWSAFTYEKLGTDDERTVTSYRTEHSGRCYAVEIFTPRAPKVASSTGYTVQETIMNFLFAN